MPWAEHDRPLVYVQCGADKSHRSRARRLVCDDVAEKDTMVVL